jgi:hypothetical protein
VNDLAGLATLARQRASARLAGLSRQCESFVVRSYLSPIDLRGDGSSVCPELLHYLRRNQLNRASYELSQSACCLQQTIRRRLVTQITLQTSVQPRAGPEAITPRANPGLPSSGFLPQVKLMLTCRQASAPHQKVRLITCKQYWFQRRSNPSSQDRYSTHDRYTQYSLDQLNITR